MAPSATMHPPDPSPQTIRFCRGHDGVRLAYATHGSGPPLVVVSCWLSHLQHDWQSPVWQHFLDDLGSVSTLIRYDERGFGLSDWSVTDFSLDARLRDLEAIIGSLGFERFSLLGMSGGAPVALAYAAAHPDRVSRLVLYGASAVGYSAQDPEAAAAEEAFRAMIRAGWARRDPLFRRVFTNIFIPGASEERMGWFDELQRMSTSTENSVSSRIARQAVDVRDSLSMITAPTLVLHALRDRAVTFDEGSDLAARIPNARLVPMDSDNHILLADEPAWQVFMAEVREFMRPESASAGAGDVGDRIGELSAREREVLRLAADGNDNAEIAQALFLSVRTVERHLSNAYLKLGMSGRSARTAAVASLLRQEAT
jgi:pimeloyl-ACP methyl ester carboxylesterase/DNA-binding CsgD family transcriptional regulator